MKQLNKVFQTLSDSNRLRILQLIGTKECPVGEIVKSTALSQPLVSHHLKVMKEGGILLTKRKGPFVFYYLKDHKILDALALFIDIFNEEEITEPALNTQPEK